MSMATMTLTPPICSTPTIHPQRNSIFNVACCYTVPGKHCVTYCTIQHEFSKSLSYVHQLRGRDQGDILKPVPAVGSGMETSMTDSEGSKLRLKTVEIAVESQDTEKIKLKVDLNGEETQKAFDVVLSKLARSAPPIPGFRRQKGGKTAKESLAVKENKINTVQSEDELKQSFLPGNAFGFNVELELEDEETETATEVEVVNKETETAAVPELVNEETETAIIEAELK
ncbi:Trigger factor [Bienertia sinuspersici]